jgi:hypothetical protein
MTFDPSEPLMVVMAEAIRPAIWRGWALAMAWAPGSLTVRRGHYDG